MRNAGPVPLKYMTAAAANAPVEKSTMFFIFSGFV